MYVTRDVDGKVWAINPDHISHAIFHQKGEGKAGSVAEISVAGEVIYLPCKDYAEFINLISKIKFSK